MKPHVRFSFSIVFSLLISTFFIQAQNCEVPDNGTGTATLPPIGCQYNSVDPFMIIEGLPPGTTIELHGTYSEFTCCGSSCPTCSLPLMSGECEIPGGSLGGDGHCFLGSMTFDVIGTGDLEGYNRTLFVEIFSEIHTGPRNPGDPVQTFPAEYYRFQGELFGDPDFCTFHIIAGSDFGLPGPGETTLTQLPSGDFAVDSFFDIMYQIEFEGCPGSTLDGYMGTTTDMTKIEIPLAGNDFIDPAPDFWIVPESPVSSVHPGGPGGDLGPIPADFFGPGSDPFDGVIYLKGESLGSTEFPNADAIVERTTPANLPEPYPASDGVQTEIVELNLVSTAPITVTFDGGMYTELWDVELELSTYPQPTGNMNITKNDANGGVFDYSPLYVYPSLIFTKTTPPDTRVWDLGGISLLDYTNSIAYPWEHSPIGNDFNPSGTTPMELLSAGGDCELYLMPYLLRQDDFWVELDPGGVFIGGGGSGYNDGEWYYYLNYDWWNIWFYDHPFEIERTKAINVSFTINKLDPSLPSYANIVFNWSTGDWSGQGVPGRPPLPEDVFGDPGLEDFYIGRSLLTPIFNGEITGPIIIDQYFYEILEYNPEWISIDVEGWNFTISDGIINHVCSQPESGGDLFEFGDAPEDALAYPSLGITGIFPTCMNVLVSGWIQHNDVSAWFGSQADFEPDGNAGACPVFNPNQYNLDECFGNGDAGLMIPESFTITGAIGSETVVPCTGFMGMPLGYTCQQAEWGADIDIDIHNQIPSGELAYVNLLIDWNQDGQWAGSSTCPPGYSVPEHVLVDFVIPNGFHGPLSHFLGGNTFPIGPNPGYVWARFSITEMQVGDDWNGEGSFYYGETEDYLLLVEEQDELDWGDAPDSPYPTLWVNNGARHVIIPQIYLGNSIDGEPDGQPDAQALGDDNDIFYPPANDDEDGVTFTSALIPGSIATVDVVASVQGFLNAWIDFNQNGSWAELNDQIFADQILNPGLNSLTFTVPAGVAAGYTYSRFRFSILQGISFDGLAPEGEVEDYRIFIGGQTGDIPIDPDPTGSFVQNEISMALVPGTQPGIPAVLLAAYNDNPYPGGPGLGVSYSTDGGAIWTPLQLPYPLNPLGIPYQDMFDPTATADGNGNLYVAHISTDHDWTNGPESGLYVHKSIDGGVTWAAPVTIAYDGKPSGSPDPTYRFNDRCQMTCDINPTSSYYNNLYIVEIKDRGWNNPLPESDIYFSASTDGGLTWSSQIILNENIHNMGNMPVPAVAPDGTIYVCWMDYNVLTGGVGTIYMNFSPDGGATWLTQDILVRTVNLPPLRLNGGSDVLAKGAAVIDVSPTNPQEVYIVYAEASAAGGDEGDIFFIRSTDGGQNWSAPLQVNDDSTPNDQVMPWIDVKPNGTIDVTWYDRRNDLLDLNWDVYIAMSTDGGNSFTPNIQINDVSAPSPNTPSGIWMGEYLGLIVDNTHAYIAFTSSLYDINGDVFFDKIQNPLAEIDFGDASDPTYPTLLASNGARHNIDGITFLGSLIDAEPDGQPHPNALGDDINNLADEDGIVFNQIIQGSPAQITVTTSTAGYLQGWMDFNADGDWADPGEQIFTDAYIHFGYTVCLNYLVPVNANVGITYARFRFSTVGGLSYTGLATDGEVEDYEVEIIENPDIKWLQEPCEQLPGLHCTDDFDILADDWECFGGFVTDIHWWGNYEALGSGIDHFHLSIHDNDPANCLPVDTEIWGIDVPFTSVNETNTGLFNSEGGIIYKYEYFLEIPFEQTEGNTYWLDICAYSIAGDCIWRWQESSRMNIPILCSATSRTLTTPPWWDPIDWLTPPPTRFSDMAFVITSVEPEDMDYGDANDPMYPTLLASDGARHNVDGVTFLGVLIDAEPDGQPHPNALGDDNNNLDDEDGVTFTSPIYIGQSATVEVVASVDGVLNAWMDFDGNGSWGDPGEQIFTDVALTVGINNLTYYVSSNGITGPSYTRFRFSTVSGLSFTGGAPDGEVEDYEVDIEAGSYKWAQYPDPNLPGLHAHNWDSPPYGAVILADDWVCEGGWVTDIHWWGNYEMDLAGLEWRGAGIQHFHLSIHAHDPTGCLPQDPEIWGVDVPFAALTELFTGLVVNLEGSPIYLYEYDLVDPFQQIQGIQYWLDITAFCIDPQDPAHWRWQESARNQSPILCGAAEKSLPNPGVWNTISWTLDRFSDMAFMITSEPAPDMDMGDADDPTYPTLLINNGAAHIIDPTMYLGNSIDAELDGQPTADAMGDDNDGNDDEDGVSVVWPLTPNGTAWFDIIASVDGILNVWIDYNANGSWADPGEHVFVDHSVTGGASPNALLFLVPSNAIVGKTYARFRFSTVSGLTYTGIAPDGEVEDHEITIEGDLDFGDAPDPYPTLLVNDGARHLVPMTPTVYLGSLIDFEPDGLQDPNALGDDNNNLDDEDGVILPSVVVHGQMNTITVIASADGILNGWMDFNIDGDWDEADEHIFMDQALNAGNNTLNIMVPAGAYMGITYARFRFSTVGGLSYTGQAPDGEVEDYEVEIREVYKWLQEPDLFDMGMDVDATYDIGGYYPPMILADDFLCDITGPLTRIEIWGSWYHDILPMEGPGAVTFTLSIHKDIPAEQSPTGYSMPGEVLWIGIFNPYEFMFESYAIGLIEGWYNPALPLYDPLGDTECWRYIFDLMQAEPFIQEGTPDEPIVYWLDVQAQPLDDNPDCRFGWKTSVNHWNDDAVWTIGMEPYIGDWNELRYPEGHPWYPESIDLAFAIYGQESPYILVDLTAFLEGPYDGPDMNTTLNVAGIIPFNQPYDTDPLAKWYYSGTESVLGIPNTNIVDWVMVELRDADSPGNAFGTTEVDQKAAFILNDGSIVATDGSSILKSYSTFVYDPYVVIWHRNHLGILSNNPLTPIGLGVYSYDFTTPAGQAYLNGQKHLGGGIYGMMGGDGQPDGSVDSNDQINVWAPAAGTTGYQMGDYNMDTQVDNKDKNDVWYPNNGSGTQVPN